MKKFSGYLQENKFNKVALEKKILRKAKTISNAIARNPGFSMNNTAMANHAGDMEDMIDLYRETDANAWREFAKKQGWHPSVTGHDFLA